MKRIIIKTLKILIILTLSACASQRGVQLINLATKELPSETELIVTTTSPVQYKDTKLDNPPCLMLSFPEEKIFSGEDEELLINKGPIKKIKNEYYQRGAKGGRQLNFMVIELTRETPYSISSNGSSIIIKLESPEQTQSEPKKQMATTEAAAPFKTNNSNIEPGYIIGPEDVLRIEVWKHPDLSGDVLVNANGEIKLPPIRKMSVMGLTAYQLEEKLTEALSRYLIDPIVSVGVKEYNSQRVIALGETSTGIYPLKRKTTLAEFLAQIGGITKNADTFHIRLIKKDGQISIYDMNELLANPQKSEQIVLSAGDTVYVPPLEMSKVFVLGQVKAPKVINIKGKLTLVEAITEAGGCTEDAVTRSIIIVRGELGSQQGIRINLRRIIKKGDIGQNVELKPGDIVYVPKTFIADIERFLRDIAFPLTWYYWYIR